MIRVIAFLGKLPINARPVSYTYGDAVYQGTVFPQVLRQFIEYDEMNVFVTAEALTSAWSHLEGLDDARIKAVEIPDGRTPEDRWLIFDKLRNVVQDGDTVIFDITHGYRTLFFSAFLAIAFLKSARENVTVRRVLYGELGQEGAPGPVIDLTDYVSLLDWMSATDQFVDFGNSKALVNLIKKDALAPVGAAESRVALMNFASSLDDVSRSLQLALPERAMGAAYKLRHNLEQVSQLLQQQGQPRPFQPLVDRIHHAFETLALADPHREENVWESLERQRRMVRWYLDRQLLLQAIALAYEWLISYGMAYLGYSNLSDWERREEVKEYYNALNRVGRPSRLRINEARNVLENIPHYLTLHQTFKPAREVRNRLLHLSMTDRTTATPAELQVAINEICSQLSLLPLDH